MSFPPSYGWGSELVLLCVRRSILSLVDSGNTKWLHALIRITGCVVLSTLAEHERALLRAAFSTLPSCHLTRIDTHPFHVSLLRRLHVPFLRPMPMWRCGHYRAACTRARVLVRRGFDLAFARTNVTVRDLDLRAPVNDVRRLDVVAHCLPPAGGMQLSVDKTLVSSLHCDGSALLGAADARGVALAIARPRTKKSSSEVRGPRSGAPLVDVAEAAAFRDDNLLDAVGKGLTSHRLATSTPACHDLDCSRLGLSVRLVGLGTFAHKELTSKTET